MTTYCSKCGKELGFDVRFCSACGTPVGFAVPAQQGYAVVTRLTRPRAGRVISGVCAGLANSYHWDITWVRIITVLATVFSSGAGLIAYLVFWLIMPEEPYALTAGYSTTYAPPPPQTGYTAPQTGYTDVTTSGGTTPL
jgi:phage shock protein C